MKSKLAVSLLVLAFLFCQGLAFAETGADVTAVAEEVGVANDGTMEDVMVAEDSVDGVVEDVAVEDELVAPDMGSDEAEM